MLGNWPYVLDNAWAICVRYYVTIWDYVAFGIMLHSWLCRSALCRIRGYVIWHNVAFGIMLHRTYVVRRNVARPNVVRRNVVRPTVSVSIVKLNLQDKFLVPGWVQGSGLVARVVPAHPTDLTVAYL